MTMKSNSSLTELKKQAFQPKCNMENVKTSLRVQFRNRLKLLRSENINKRRNIDEDSDKIQSMINNIPVEKYGLLPSEILQIVEEVEREIRNELSMNECNQYEQDTNSIISSLLDQLNECPICNKILDENNVSNGVSICDQCTNLFSMESQ